MVVFVIIISISIKSRDKKLTELTGVSGIRGARVQAGAVGGCGGGVRSAGPAAVKIPRAG